MMSEITFHTGLFFSVTKAIYANTASAMPNANNTPKPIISSLPPPPDIDNIDKELVDIPIYPVVL
jgi:hypothetical protein